MKALLDVRTFILALILTVIGVGYTVANVVVIPLRDTPTGVQTYPINYQTDNSGDLVQIFNADGLTLTAACPGGFLVVRATTTVPNSSLRGYGVQHGSVPAAFVNNIEHEDSMGGFQTDEEVNILPGAVNDVRGYLVYYNSDSVINIEYTAEERGGFGPNQFSCGFFGFALTSKG